jgi:hypothetical protein
MGQNSTREAPVPEKQHITISYRAVTNARGGKGEDERKTASRHSSAAHVISCVSGATIIDPRTQALIKNPRDDVHQIAVHNGNRSGLTPTWRDLRRLANAVVTKAPRGNAREGTHYVIALPGDRRERWDRELEA